MKATADKAAKRSANAKGLMMFSMATLGILALWRVTAKEGQEAPFWIEVMLLGAAAILASSAITLVVRSIIDRFQK